MAAADPVAGVASAASGEISTAIAALFRSLLSRGETLNENCEIYCEPIPARVTYFAAYFALIVKIVR